MPDDTTPASATVYQLRVVVHGVSPLIWRRLLVLDPRDPGNGLPTDLVIDPGAGMSTAVCSCKT